ncbi:MAG TPA: hypothetical protein VHZ73_06070, partial [Vicinamibacterales bacterium]|nr:hypothetical protein [Vicinamibacterales bacterium]
MTTRHVWKSLVLAAGLLFARGVTANAQTVWVRDMTPGATGELTLGGDKVSTGTADSSGLVQMTVPDGRVTDAVSMHVYVEECGNLRRVILGQEAFQPPATDSLCQRFPITGLFDVHPDTTFVVNATGTHAVLIRQGPAYAEWLHPVLDSNGNVKISHEPLPTGLMIGAGASLAKFGHVVSDACGDATACNGQDLRFSPSATLTLWATNFFGLEVGYFQPVDVTAAGTNTNLTFATALQSRIATGALKIGLPAGPVRFYVNGGVDYALTVQTTTQTVVASTKGEGGTQTLALKTKGVGIYFGGGFETWMGRRLAFYIDAGRAALKGNPATDSDQGKISDSILYGTFGLRFR